METQYNHYDYLRYELFEMLIPSMLYEGTEEQKEEFFQLLIHDGKNVIRNMYSTMCGDDKLPYPYEKEDFKVNMLERGGIRILQILLPPYNPDISDILRAYLMFTRLQNGSYVKRYFVIKRFKDGSVFNLCITPEMEKLLGEELTEHVGDMEYEYWKLVRDYSRVIFRNDKSKEKQGKAQQAENDESESIENKSDAGKWSMDWGNFDWETVLKKLEMAEKEIEQKGGDKKLYDIGITEEQFEEYFQWLYENAPEEHGRFMMYVLLREKGVEEKDIEFCLSHPEELMQALDMVREGKGME